MDDLLALVSQIVPFHMTHNAEPEAVDLLLEVGGSKPAGYNIIPESTICTSCPMS